MKKVLLKIDGMTCSACSSGLEKYLNKQDGIKQATVNLIMNNANIEYDDKKLTLEQVEKFVEKAGFTSLGIDNFEKEEKKKLNEKYKSLSEDFFATEPDGVSVLRAHYTYRMYIGDEKWASLLKGSYSKLLEKEKPFIVAAENALTN